MWWSFSWKITINLPKPTNSKNTFRQSTIKYMWRQILIIKKLKICLRQNSFRMIKFGDCYRLKISVSILYSITLLRKSTHKKMTIYVFCWMKLRSTNWRNSKIMSATRTISRQNKIYKQSRKISKKLKQNKIFLSKKKWVTCSLGPKYSLKV